MSIEDSMKENLLLSFSERINEEEFILKNIGDTDDYQDLMLHFDKVIREYQKLDVKYKSIITDTVRRMSKGMILYTHKPINTYEEWDEYCHYVAGLVGIGLSKIFIQSDLEKNDSLHDENLSNQMGLFLQKTNIIRDFAEDLEQRRFFWPKESWNNRVTTVDMLQSNYKNLGVMTLNDVILDALEHVPSCLEFLESLDNKNIFRFCAIPQIMALATLLELYNNPKVLKENIKLRKGRTAKYFMSINDFPSLKKEFIIILRKLNKKDSSGRINKILIKI